ncbi:hypothetical protein [Natrialba aegyptia]|nr:hypothetical protein [Natrialba aegyptia]
MVSVRLRSPSAADSVQTGISFLVPCPVPNAAIAALGTPGVIMLCAP